ncbi:MAG: hypothetical protein O2794_03750, partial [bacterium]|nr:hypothetical protein [bacterium]
MENPERQFEQKEFVDKLYERALSMLQDDRPHPDDFKDIRSNEEISADNAYVADREEKFREADRAKNRKDGRPENEVRE